MTAAGPCVAARIQSTDSCTLYGRRSASAVDGVSQQPTALSVVTATYNAAAVLPRLIASLQAQTDPDFEWVVADGASTDRTLGLLSAAARTLNVHVDSRPDAGIYDALNHAVRAATGGYYIVMGADDELAPDAVAQYKRVCSEAHTDFVTAYVSIDGRIRGVYKHRWPWLSAMYAYISGHAVGVAIRRTLHDRVGYYDQRFSLVADQLFVMSALRAGASVAQAEFVAGNYSPTGTSSVDGVRRAVEKFRMQRKLGSNLLLQAMLLGWRTAKWTVLRAAGRRGRARR